MGARLRVFLTSKQDQNLLNLRKADVPQKVKDRAEIIRLSAHGWYVKKIAAHFQISLQTVRDVLHKWQKLGTQGLWERPGRGGKAKWKQEDIVFLEECLKKEPRTYLLPPCFPCPQHPIFDPCQELRTKNHELQTTNNELL